MDNQLLDKKSKSSNTWFKDVIPLQEITWITSYTVFEEAVDGWCSVKKVFLKISQNSQKSTHGGVSF